MEKTIYLDNAATTFPKPEIVYKQMDEFCRSFGVNAGRGSYKLARTANEMIDETRSLLCELTNFNTPNKVIFTASATQAMNQIINGIQWDEYKTVYVTPFEHNAIMRPLHMIQKKFNINIETIPFDKESFQLDFDKMKLDFSRKYPDYIFMSHVSNVTGYVLPIEQIVEEAKKYNSIITLDCAQSMGLIPIDTTKLNVDYFVFAGHKTLYGPFGIAGYLDNSKIELEEFIIGGTGSDSLNLNMPRNYPNRYESGSQNMQAISGLNASLKWIKSVKVENIRNKEAGLTRQLMDKLNYMYGIKLYVPSDLNKHVGIVSFNLDDFNPNDLGQILDQDYNIAVRTGYHCAPKIHEFLGTKELGTVRCSLSYFNDENDINYIIDCLNEL